MIRLRIALGVASSLVAVAALTIVFSGTGQAQGGPNVFVTNTPLPVTGNVTATLAGNVSAIVVNPATSPVLTRDVDAKELWQENRSIDMLASFPSGFIDFDPVPAGKALVIEHVNVRLTDQGFDAAEFARVRLENTQPFGTSTSLDAHFLVPRSQDDPSVADAVMKFYVAPGDVPRVFVARKAFNLDSTATALLTGYLVNYP